MNQYVNDFTRTTEIYYNELKKFKPLTRAKEKKLIKKCKKGNLKAKNEIIEANLKFVFDIAKKYTGRGVPILELISEGNMGLLKAIDKFDETRDIKFISYAVWWIRQAMSDAIKKRNLINFVDIDTERSNDTKFDKIFTSEDNDDEDEGIQFSNEENESYEEINSAQSDLVSRVLLVLHEREREIIESYYGINGKEELTLNEMGEKYHLTSERVSQIKKLGLKKLLREILVLEPSDYL